MSNTSSSTLFSGEPKAKRICLLIASSLLLALPGCQRPGGGPGDAGAGRQIAGSVDGALVADKASAAWGDPARAGRAAVVGFGVAPLDHVTGGPLCRQSRADAGEAEGP